MTRTATIEAPAADRIVRSDDNAPDPFDALKAHMDDLNLETGNWMDGHGIETEAQAAVVDRLIDDWKDAITAATDARDKLKEPHVKAANAIQERFYPLIGDTQKVTGIAIRAKKVLLQAKTIWGNKVRAQQQAEAERMRREAAAAAQKAAEAARSAVGDLQATEDAESLVREAQTLLRGASIAEKATPKGLRTEWRVEIADAAVAMRTIWARHRDEVLGFAKTLAERDVREGKRTLEGFTITEEKVAV